MCERSCDHNKLLVAYTLIRDRALHLTMPALDRVRDREQTTSYAELAVDSVGSHAPREPTSRLVRVPELDELRDGSVEPAHHRCEEDEMDKKSKNKEIECIHQGIGMGIFHVTSDWRAWPAKRPLDRVKAICSSPRPASIKALHA